MGNPKLDRLLSVLNNSRILKPADASFGVIQELIRYLQSNITNNEDLSVVVSGIVSGINQLTGDVEAGPGTGSQVATIPNGTVVEAQQSLSDLTTFNVSTARHGYVPKAPNDATKFLNGIGGYSIPSGTGAPIGALYITLAVDGTLTAERVLTGTANQIILTDNGAGSTLVLSLPQNFDTAAIVRLGRLGLGASADPSAVAKFVGQFYSLRFDAGNSGTAKTLDWNNGNNQLVTLTNNVTFTLSNPKDGGQYMIIIDSGMGAFTATWPGSVLWPSGVAPVITIAAGKRDVVKFDYDLTAGKYYGSYQQNY